MSYEEYEETRKEIINKVAEKTFFTSEYFEKLKEKMKKEKIWEEKINTLAQEYFTIIQDDIFQENISKDFNFVQYGYYVILEYCLNEIKKNDKNLMQGFAGNVIEGDD